MSMRAVKRDWEFYAFCFFFSSRSSLPFSNSPASLIFFFFVNAYFSYFQEEQIAWLQLHHAQRFPSPAITAIGGVPIFALLLLFESIHHDFISLCVGPSS